MRCSFIAPVSSYVRQKKRKKSRTSAWIRYFLHFILLFSAKETESEFANNKKWNTFVIYAIYQDELQNRIANVCTLTHRDYYIYLCFVRGRYGDSNNDLKRMQSLYDRYCSGKREGEKKRATHEQMEICEQQEKYGWNFLSSLKRTEQSTADQSVSHNNNACTIHLCMLARNLSRHQIAKSCCCFPPFFSCLFLGAWAHTHF